MYLLVRVVLATSECANATAVAHIVHLSVAAWLTAVSGVDEVRRDSTGRFALFPINDPASHTRVCAGENLETFRVGSRENVAHCGVVVTDLVARMRVGTKNTS